MSEFREIRIALTEEQIEAIKTAVASGEYPDTSEVVRQAIRDWLVKREARQRDIERLRQLWDEGKASGPPKPLDFDELRAEARRRVNATTKASGDDR
jgi:antitoxin ParD1/3/4